MSRLSPENVQRAREIIARYPRSRSALIPLCHVAQEQDGWLAPDAMEHIAELLELEAAEVLGTASFYEMFKLHPVGKYLIGVCTNLTCALLGADELLAHASERLGCRPGSTTEDGVFTLESMECLADCDGAPCLQVNYRYFDKVTPQDFDRLVDDLRSGRLAQEVPPHGTTTRVRQQVTTDRWAGSATRPEPASDPAMEDSSAGH